MRCLPAGLCEQRGDPLELAHRVPDDLVIVHCGAAAEGGVVGGLAERVPGQILGFAGRDLVVFVAGREGRREMRGESAGQDRGWPASPSLASIPAATRSAEPRSIRAPSAWCCSVASCSAASAPGRSPVRARMAAAGVKAMPRTVSQAPARSRVRQSSMGGSAAYGSLRQITSAAAQEAVVARLRDMPLLIKSSPCVGSPSAANDQPR